MKLHPHFRLRAIGILSAAAILLVGPVHAAIIADFTDGDGTTSVDQYTGIAGNGWVTPWQANTTGASAGTTLLGTVENLNPLNGGGRYLSSFLTAGSGIGKGVQQRQFESFGNINLAAPFTVSFDLRLDSDLTTFTAATDYFQAFDRPFDSDFGSNGSWLVRAAGASVNGIPAKNWMFYNGGKNGGAFNAANFVDSGVTLVTGTVYHFEINVDPTLLEYTVSINGGAFSAPMGFRIGDASNLGRLNFGGQVSDAGEILGYSLDSVDITAVPEPSVTALSIAAGLTGLVVLRRRRNRA